MSADSTPLDTPPPGSPTDVSTDVSSDVSTDDTPARLTALDPARSFIVQAPAGSGKTGLLTQRFLRLLAVVEAPEQIVAITFTRKAAAEMRRRILQALSATHVPENTGAHERLTCQLAAAARARAEERGWQLQAHPARLRIQTIDALCHSLAAQLPLLARAGADLQVAPEPRELYRQAARRTLSLVTEGSAAVRTLLLHRDNQFLQTEALLTGMLARRDQWLPLILGRDSASLRVQLERDLATEILGHVQQVSARWPRKNLQVVCRLRTAAAQRLQAGEDLFADHVPDPIIDDLPLWTQLSGLLLTQKGSWRRSLNVRNGFPPACKAEKAELLDLIEELGRIPGLERQLAVLGELPAPRFSDEQWQVAEALLELLQNAAAQLELVFREVGQVDFPAVAQAARHSLGTDEAPSELALALDYRIRHLLVDEFQDTSYLQIELVRGLTGGWTPADGRTLFCVGDPMQSIYRFRQAEVGLFLLARERGIGELRPDPLTLTRNFRSTAGLVSWFNGIFACALPAEDDLARGAVRFVPSAAARGGAAHDAQVHVHPAFAPDAAAEGAAVADEVAEVLRDSPADSIGILVKQRAHAVGIAAALRGRAIRFQAVELESLVDQPVVQDLMALTRALLHRGDRTAWLALLRSPVCGLTLGDLDALVGAGATEPDLTIWQLLTEPARVTLLGDDGRQRAARLAAVFEHAWSLQDRLALRTWVERTWITLGGPAAVLHRQALDDAAAFFERLDALGETGNVAAGTAFEEQFAQLFARPDPSAPANVQIMTIHKAKGLEFDTVILPGLGRGQSRSDAPLLRWLEVPRPEGEPGLLLAPIERKGGQGDPLARYVGMREQERADFERARLLYVAVTRARRALHLFGHVNVRGAGGNESMSDPQGRSLLAMLWPAVQADFERAFDARAQAAALQPPVMQLRRTRLRRLSLDWMLPPAEAPVASRSPAADAGTGERPEFDWASEASRHVGTVVHAELEQWSGLQALPTRAAVVAAQPRLQRMLHAMGIPQERLAPAVERVQLALTGLLDDERGRWIFDSTHSEVSSELALSGSEGQDIVNIIIDRTFVDRDGVRWIVDFKTSTHEGSDLESFLDNEVRRYRSQMQRYARLLRSAGPQPLRIGLYFPLLRQWREWSA